MREEGLPFETLPAEEATGVFVVAEVGSDGGGRLTQGRPHREACEQLAQEAGANAPALIARIYDHIVDGAVILVVGERARCAHEPSLVFCEADNAARLERSPDLVAFAPVKVGSLEEGLESQPINPLGVELKLQLAHA